MHFTDPKKLVSIKIVCIKFITTSRGGVRSTRGLGPTITVRGLGPTMTARGHSSGISIGMLPQTLIMSILDQPSRLGARIISQTRHKRHPKYYTKEFELEE
jgi:hypothetical protein